MALKQGYSWPRVHFGLARWVESVTELPVDALPGDQAQVSWANYDTGVLPKPYVSIQKITAVSIGFAGTYQRVVPTEQRITITQTVVGEFVVVCLIWSEVRIIVQAGDAITDTRDKFLTACQARVVDTQEPLVFVADGTDDILVTALEFAIPDVTEVQGCTVAVTTEAEAKVKSGSKRLRVRFQLYGFPPGGLESADAYATALQDDFETTDGIETMAPYGIGPEGTPSTAQDASAISGALREVRVFFDASVVTRDTTYVFAGVSSIAEVAPPIIEGTLAPGADDQA